MNREPPNKQGHLPKDSSVVCNCADIPPTMPTFRTEHLPICPVWAVEHIAEISNRVTEPVMVRSKEERFVPRPGKRISDWLSIRHARGNGKGRYLMLSSRGRIVCSLSMDDAKRLRNWLDGVIP